MINNKLRAGNFTSSQIFRLMGAPTPRKTYIEEKNLERKLNLSIEPDAHSQDMAWGTFLEQRVHELLGMEYELCSDQTDQHQTIKCWAGSKDFLVKGLKIAELKCYALKNFAYFTDSLLTQDPAVIKKNDPKEYWQAVSNAIINKVPKAELISYCPYMSELDAIREMALDYNGLDAWKYRFIYEKSPENLPHLEDGGYYKNLNAFEFTPPKEDVEALTNAVLLAEKELIPFHINRAVAA